MDPQPTLDQLEAGRYAPYAEVVAALYAAVAQRDEARHQRDTLAAAVAQRDEARHQRDTLAARLTMHLGGQP